MINSKMTTILFCSMLITACGSGYQPPIDQCVGKGTKCEHGEPVRGRDGTDGKDGSTGPQGPRGQTGQTGLPGSAGRDGSSCSTTQAIGGVLVSCTDGTSAVILNGKDGTNGTDGVNAPPTPYTVTELVDPCGKQTTYDEVLMRLANNQLIAHYASGSLQYLTVIGPGSYITTDGSNCYFSVDSNLQIYNEHN